MHTLAKVASVLLVTLSACAVDDSGTTSADDPSDDDTTAIPGTPVTPAPDAGTPPAPRLAETCADIALAQAGAQDGQFTLHVAGDSAKPWTAYCADMATTPVEYLDLVNTWFGQNMATFPTNGAIGGTTVATSYSKLRIDPITLEVDIDDMRFAQTQGAHPVPGSSATATSVSFGVAINCNDFFDAGANINLGGTAFRYDGAFAVSAQVTADSAHQVFEIIAKGNCGFNGPGAMTAMPLNSHTGGRMQLTYAK